MRVAAGLWLWAGVVLAAQPCAHRGDNERAPENTLPAIRAAVERGAAQIEFDVKLTRDGRLLILHDATVDRTTNGRGRLAEMTFAEARALDAGAWFGEGYRGTRIPTLEEVVRAIPAGTLMNIHLDAGSKEVAGAAWRVVKGLGRMRDALWAATEEQTRQLKELEAGVRICNMSRQAELAEYVERTIAMKAEFLQIRDEQGGVPERLGEMVRRLHEHGVKVNYFGAQEEGKIRALAEAGVDYILTDRLELCQRVLGGAK